MKKAFTKVMLTALTLVTLLTIIPLSANASTSNKQQVFSYLTQEMGLNSAAACGVMANIEKESNFKSTTIIRDSNGLQSGGLCMWNGARLKNLKNYCNKYGFNYLSVQGQMNYLEHELKSSYYKHVYNYLKNVANNSGGAYNAAYYWCYYFEVPASRSTKAVQRGRTASNSYWPKYGNQNVNKSTLSLSDTALDLNSSLSLKWTSGGANADYYKVYVAEKNTETGKYDWAHSKIYKTTSLSKKISTNSLGIGNYCVFVQGVNDLTGNYKNSNYVAFTVRCLTHQYKSSVTKNPTLTAEGVKTSVCIECGKKITEKISKLTYKTLIQYPMTPLSSNQNMRTMNSISVTWEEYQGADGYEVFIRSGENWKLIARVKAGEKRVATATVLKPATEYKFTIRAYVDVKGERYYTYAADTFVTYTETQAPELVTIKSKGDGKVYLKWNEVKGADMYAIYVSDKADGDYKRVAMVDGGKTVSYTVSDLPVGKTCYFRVYAVIECKTQNVYSSSSNVKGTIALL